MALCREESRTLTWTVVESGRIAGIVRLVALSRSRERFIERGAEHLGSAILYDYPERRSLRFSLCGDWIQGGGRSGLGPL